MPWAKQMILWSSWIANTEIYFCLTLLHPREKSAVKNLHRWAVVGVNFKAMTIHAFGIWINSCVSKKKPFFKKIKHEKILFCFTNPATYQKQLYCFVFSFRHGLNQTSLCLLFPFPFAFHGDWFLKPKLPGRKLSLTPQNGELSMVMHVVRFFERFTTYFVLLRHP